MSAIYDRVLKVPVWVIVDTKDEGTDKAISSYLSDAGAFERVWPSQSFVETFKQMGSRGWAHATKKPYPFFMDMSFLPVAVGFHIKKLYGESKILSGAPHRPWSQALNKKITCENDLVRIFDEVMMLEETMSLSSVFDIGSKCFSEGAKHRVFYTVGSPIVGVLRELSDNIISVGPGGNIDTTQIEDSQKVVDSLDDLLVQTLQL